MWTLDHPGLPETPSTRGYGTLCTIDLGYENPPLATIDYQAQWNAPGIVVPWTSTTSTQILPPPGSSSVTFTPTGEDLVHLDTIVVNGATYTLAQNPEAPQPGEFTWQTASPEDFDYQETNLPIDSITLHLSDTTSDPLTVTLTGGNQRSTVPSDVLSPKLLKGLEGLPVTGDISWTLSLEQHPSGSMELFCQGEAIHAIRDRFKKGSEWELFGIGFSVSDYREKLEPFRQYHIFISLTGKWARPKYNRPSFLHPEAWEPSMSETVTDSSGAVAASTERSRTKISVKELAKQVGVPFLPLGDASWNITVPSDSAKDAAVLWSSGIQELARPNQGFIDWNAANGVYIRQVQSGKRWQYSVPELEISYQGDCEHATDHRGYAVEYANIELAGNFSNARNTREAKPTWKRRKPQIVKLISGDARAKATPNVPAPLPEGVNRLRDLSLNWDSSGPTRTIRFVTTQDGQPSQTIEVIWGFCYLGVEIYNANLQELNGEPTDFWRMVSFKKQKYLYDAQYGYPLGYNTTGWRMGRCKQESTSQDGIPDTEVLDLSDPLEALEYDLYVFRKIPILERSREVHTTYNRYYKDTDEQPAWISYEYTNRDGSSETRFVKDPTWAPAMFSLQSLTYCNSFFKLPNPEYDPSEGYILPDSPPPVKYFITGEETLVRRSLKIEPGPKSRKIVLQPGENQSNETSLAPDLFTERVIEDSAQNSQFGQKAVRETFTKNTDRPSPSTRLPSLYEQEEPESNDAVADKTGDSTDYRYTLTTPGFTQDDPIESSLSYSNARTIEQALEGAKTEYYLRDVQESIQYSYLIPFNPDLRPLDQITINAQGETYVTAPTSISNKLTIQGDVEGEALITTEPSQITAGIDRTVPIQQHKTRRPKLNGEDNSAGAGESTRKNHDQRLILGNLFKTELENRGNY